MCTIMYDAKDYVHYTNKAKIKLNLKFTMRSFPLFVSFTQMPCLICFCLNLHNA